MNEGIVCSYQAPSKPWHLSHFFSFVFSLFFFRFTTSFSRQYAMIILLVSRSICVRQLNWYWLKTVTDYVAYEHITNILRFCFVSSSFCTHAVQSLVFIAFVCLFPCRTFSLSLSVISRGKSSSPKPFAAVQPIHRLYFIHT